MAGNSLAKKCLTRSMDRVLPLPTGTKVEILLKGTHTLGARTHLSVAEFTEQAIVFPEEGTNAYGIVLWHVTVKGPHFRGVNGTNECFLFPPHYSVYYDGKEIILNHSSVHGVGFARFPALARLALRFLYWSFGGKQPSRVSSISKIST